MITKFFMDLGLTITKFFVNLLPGNSIVLPTQEIHGFAQFLWGLNDWLPVSDLALQSSVVASYLLMMHGAKAIKWAWDSILAVIP